MADKIKPEAHLSRVQPLLTAIERVCFLLEDTGNAATVADLTTAVEACLETAHRLDLNDRLVQGVRHG